MSEKNKDNEHDTETDLQEELRREASEVSDTVGDIAENRNVSGSSTWTTLPDESKDSDRD